MVLGSTPGGFEVEVGVVSEPLLITSVAAIPTANTEKATVEPTCPFGPGEKIKLRVDCCCPWTKATTSETAPDTWEGDGAVIVDVMVLAMLKFGLGSFNLELQVFSNMSQPRYRRQEAKRFRRSNEEPSADE